MNQGGRNSKLYRFVLCQYTKLPETRKVEIILAYSRVNQLSVTEREIYTFVLGLRLNTSLLAASRFVSLYIPGITLEYD